MNVPAWKVTAAEHTVVMMNSSARRCTSSCSQGNIGLAFDRAYIKLLAQQCSPDLGMKTPT